MRTESGQVSTLLPGRGPFGSYLSSRGMKHTDILARNYVNQFARFDVPDFNESRLKCKHVGIIEGKRLRRTLPLNLPVGSCPPAVAIHEEAKVGIVEQKLAVQPFNVNRLHVLSASDKVE